MGDEELSGSDMTSEIRRLRARVASLESAADLRLRNVTDRSSEAITLTDEEGRIVVWNVRMAEISGIPAPDAIGQPVWEVQQRALLPELRSPDALDQAAIITREVLKTGEVPDQYANYRQVIRHADGTDRVHCGRVIAIPTESGFVLGSFTRDVTEQDRAERGLRAQSRQQAALADIGRHALAAVSQQEVMDHAVGSVAGTLDVDACTVLELRTGIGELFLAADNRRSPNDAAEADTVHRGDVHALLALRLGETIVVEDFGTDSRFSSAERSGHSGMASGVCVIIGDAGDPLGVLAVHHRHKRMFASDEVRFVETVANTLAEAARRFNAEARLRESEALFRTMYESSNIGISRVSLDHRILAINDAYSTMLGYEPAELIGRTIWDITDPASQRASRILQERMVRGEIEAYKTEKRYVRKDGSTFWGLLGAALVRDTAGDPMFAVGNVIDLSERKRAEDAVRKLSVGVEQSPVSIVITDLEGTITYVNRKFCDLSGFDREEAIGENPRILKSGAQSEEIYRELWLTITSGGTWTGQFQNKKKNGELYWEDATIGPITDDDGQVTHFIAFKEDITERKELELQLLQSQRLEAIGRLAGGVAHDFNNLLTVINGYAALLLDELDEADSKRPDVVQIITAGQRAGELTNQLLAFSRKQVIKPEIVSLNRIVTDMTAMLRRLTGEDVELVTVLAGDLGLVRVDSGQMNQVIMNLVINARDALSGGGRITIETANSEIDYEYQRHHMGARPGIYCVLRIADNGVGMDTATQTHAFEPFFTTKDVGEGTGLGLSTVYGIVKQHNGYVWLRSEKGHGTTVTVYLPRVAEQQPAQQRSRTPAPDPRGTETILLVEDDDMVRNLTAGILERAGYTVLQARDGSQALGVFATSGKLVGLLLTDVVMPGLGGKELADRILEMAPELPVIFVSGYTDEAISRAGVLRESTTLLSKPFRPADLLRRVRDVLDDRD